MAWQTKTLFGPKREGLAEYRCLLQMSDRVVVVARFRLCPCPGTLLRRQPYWLLFIEVFTQW